MFSASNGKIKLPPPDAHAVTSPLRCLFNGPFRDLHFNATDNRLIPVHDVVFLDDFEHNVKPLIYRPVPSEASLPVVTVIKNTNNNNHITLTTTTLPPNDHHHDATR
ncbi:uncharacterized protein LOC111519649 [Drosophila willistoni]|uniref:uncharacterized protein LOC111519649 n=1 Tax=Drosophila willistoni TaxID=7260 RepID=UPI000C26D851|nr:uncharacterized protein LOC111519649 [Drosophila willistoni]